MSISRKTIPALGLIAVTLLGCAADYDGAATANKVLVGSDIEEMARKATLRVRAVGCSTDTFGSGSAFTIGGDTLITNRHVVENTQMLQLSTWDGQDFDVKVGSVSYVNDLAILRIDGSIEDSLEIGPTAVEGQAVFAVGYPEGGAWALTSGEVYDIVEGKEYSEQGKVIRMTADVQPGNSGGPLLDVNGMVVGVVFAQDAGSDLNLAITADQIKVLADSTTTVGTKESC